MSAISLNQYRKMGTDYTQSSSVYQVLRRYLVKLPNAQKQTSVLHNPQIAEGESISTIGQIFTFENNIASSL